jgi:DNA (cytosine-5)-methyltransferase 1
VSGLTHLDLFSGIGGFALAAKWTGFRTVGFSEVEPYACRLLTERFPDVPNIGDVRQRANFARFAGRIDVLTGGFPCQPWSVAGQQRGAEDHRHLWPAMCDVIETVQPAWIIGENVPGIISVGLEPVCADLAKLGYACQPFIVPACAVGAKQLRNRVWIVGRHSERYCIQGGAHQGAEKTSRARYQLSRPVFSEIGDAVSAARIWRASHGVSPRMDPPRNRAVGNAIVPQVAAQFFRFIAEIEGEQ